MPHMQFVHVIAYPKKTTLGSPVPVVFANHLRHDGVGNEDNRVVGCAGEGDGLDAQAGRGNLSSEGVANRP